MINARVLPNGDHEIRVASRDQGRTWCVADVSPEGDIEMVPIPDEIVPSVKIAYTTKNNWLGFVTVDMSDRP